MRTSQEHRDALMERWKNAAKNAPAPKPEECRDVFQGKRYRENKSGCIVTVLNSTDYCVVFQRENYSGESELGRYWFERKFTEVKSES
ncbi:DUF4222 domain-containing protein [Klebsiella aerogenes]|uniref:DUF4222 domain-containing protein n=1 Tax=Klebsiella aerogenes TaxID=548 RepID=UPI0034D249EA